MERNRARTRVFEMMCEWASGNFNQPEEEIIQVFEDAGFDIEAFRKEISDLTERITTRTKEMLEKEASEE